MLGVLNGEQGNPSWFELLILPATGNHSKDCVVRVLIVSQEVAKILKENLFKSRISMTKLLAYWIAQLDHTNDPHVSLTLLLGDIFLVNLQVLR